MSLLKKLAGLAVGAAALGAAAYVLKNREHGEEYEHIVGPEDEVEPETESAEPADEDASAVAEPAPAAARSSWATRRPPARRTARSTPPRSLTPLWQATGRSRAARADIPNAQGASLFYGKGAPFLYLLLRGRAAEGRGLPSLHKCHGRRVASPLAAAP